MLQCASAVAGGLLGEGSKVPDIEGSEVFKVERFPERTLLKLLGWLAEGS